MNRKKRKNKKIDFEKINIRGIVKATIIVAVVGFVLYLNIYPLFVKMSSGNDFCRQYDKEGYDVDYYVTEMVDGKSVEKFYCCKFKFNGDMNKCVYYFDVN